jgi:hypothetical protein
MKTQAAVAAALIAWTSAGLSQTTAPAERPSPEQEVPPPSAPVSPTPGIVPGPAPARRPVLRSEPGPVEPHVVGSMLLYPEIVVTGMVDDNVYSTQTDEIRDEALIFSPALWVQSNWQRHFLGLHASADATRYDTQHSEDTNDYRVSGEGRYDISAQTNVYGGARVAREHEDRESPDARNGIEPTKYKAARGYVGAFHQFGALSARAALNVLSLDFDDVPFVMGSGSTAIINNDDRDRTQTTGGLRVGYEVTQRVVPFVQFSAEQRRYKSGVDDLGLHRDSHGRRFIVGLRTFAPGMFKLEAFAGRMQQKYDDDRLADVHEPTLGGTFVWNLGERTTLSGSADRTIEETTVFAGGTTVVSASSYVNTYGQLDLHHRFTARFLVYAFGSLSRADYQGIERVDDYSGTGVGGVYRVAQNFYVDVTYQHRKLNSQVPTEDFRRNQVFARLAFPL